MTAGSRRSWRFYSHPAEGINPSGATCYGETSGSHRGAASVQGFTPGRVRLWSQAKIRLRSWAKYAHRLRGQGSPVGIPSLSDDRRSEPRDVVHAPAITLQRRMVIAGPSRGASTGTCPWPATTLQRRMVIARAVRPATPSATACGCRRHSLTSTTSASGSASRPASAGANPGGFVRYRVRRVVL